MAERGAGAGAGAGSGAGPDSSPPAVFRRAAVAPAAAGSRRMRTGATTGFSFSSKGVTPTRKVGHDIVGASTAMSPLPVPASGMPPPVVGVGPAGRVANSETEENGGWRRLAAQSAAPKVDPTRCRYCACKQVFEGRAVDTLQRFANALMGNFAEAKLLFDDDTGLPLWQLEVTQRAAVPVCGLLVSAFSKDESHTLITARHTGGNEVDSFALFHQAVAQLASFKSAPAAPRRQAAETFRSSAGFSWGVRAPGATSASKDRRRLRKPAPAAPSPLERAGDMLQLAERRGAGTAREAALDWLAGLSRSAAGREALVRAEAPRRLAGIVADPSNPSVNRHAAMVTLLKLACAEDTANLSPIVADCVERADEVVAMVPRALVDRAMAR